MITYRLKQDTTSWSRYPGHWFAQPVNLRTVGNDELAELIARNCSPKASDVLAVLREMAEVVGQQLTDSARVKIDRLGVLKLSLECTPCPERRLWTPAMVRRRRVLFLPDQRLFPEGVGYTELPFNDRKTEPRSAG